MNAIPINQSKEPEGFFRLAKEMGIPFRVTGGFEMTHEIECSMADLEALRAIAIEQSGMARWMVFKKLGLGVYHGARAIETVHGLDLRGLLARGLLEQHPTDPRFFRYKRDPDVDGGWSVLG